MYRPLAVTFICGSLEIGRDGVGDYTRRLCGEMIRTGHQASVVAINDRYLAGEKESDTGNNRSKRTATSGLPDDLEIQMSDGTAVPVLRLSSRLTWSSRIRLTNRFIDQKAPDWLSLQFVPYAFHPRGIPLKLPARLLSIIRDRPLHVMFHELWVGQRSRIDVKHAFIAKAQKRLIRRLGGNVRKAHSHLPEYVDALCGMGIATSALPLYSNIANRQPTSGKRIRRKDDRIAIAVFSHFELPQSLIEFIRELSFDCASSGRSLRLEFFGSIREPQRSLWFDKVPDGVELFFHEWLPDDALSVALNNCQTGATGLSRHSLPKSGSVAAFIAHQLPIISPENAASDPRPFREPLLNEVFVNHPKLACIRERVRSVKVAGEHISLSAIAKRFIKDLDGK